MWKIAEGNILEADTQALVNTVNTVGVMGKGIALQFKKAFPEMFEAYEAVCKAKKLQPRPDARLRPGLDAQPPIHYQLPDQGSLEGEV